MTLDAGTTQTLDPSTLRPEGSDAAVAAVTVDVVGARGDLRPAWSVVASAGPPSGDGDETPSLLSVLLPVVDAPAPGTVAVRASDTAGLGG